MHKREAKFQTKFNEWVRKELKITAAFELKQCETSLPFNRVEDHQINALLAAKHGTLAYKIPDDTRSYKPFDSFSLAGVPAFVVVLYRLGSGAFYCIDIDLFIEARDKLDRRSLCEPDAKAIATYHGTLGKK